MQQIFKEMFNFGPEFVPGGRHFDHMFPDAETFKVGKLNTRAISTSGHTPADMSYQFDFFQPFAFRGLQTAIPNIPKTRRASVGGSGTAIAGWSPSTVATPKPSITSFWQVCPQ